jgi:prevent-host-death family protein
MTRCEMANYNIHEAKTHFSKLLERVKNGEEVIISRAGKPVARILPLSKPVSARVPGMDKGSVHIHPDFDAPLEEFEV